jgi:hypothetical protein
MVGSAAVERTGEMSQSCSSLGMTNFEKMQLRCETSAPRECASDKSAQQIYVPVHLLTAVLRQKPQKRREPRRKQQSNFG